MLAELMLEWGCQVFASDNADELIRRLDAEQIRPDLLVCDYRLPNGVTAVHVVKRFRELWGGAVPALILTGDTAPEALQQINASGAILLHKPIAPARLQSMMYFALHGES
jgi:CheY-like chemotaxis protein